LPRAVSFFKAAPPEQNRLDRIKQEFEIEKGEKLSNCLKKGVKNRGDSGTFL